MATADYPSVRETVDCDRLGSVRSVRNRSLPGPQSFKAHLGFPAKPT